MYDKEALFLIVLFFHDVSQARNEHVLIALLSKLNQAIENFKKQSFAISEGLLSKRLCMRMLQWQATGMSSRFI